MPNLEEYNKVTGPGERRLEKLVLHDNRIVLDSRGKKAKIVYFTFPRIVENGEYIQTAPNWANAVLIGEENYQEGSMEMKISAVSYHLIKK